jgi:hypothetical protein
VLFEIAPREGAKDRYRAYNFLTGVFLAAALLVWIGV